ncbi:MAG TPA: glycosyltransferase family 39 protein, partial [Candidatus Binatia bacterium]|nr:glycosyltransferase family 39 protein [Candidatus Binatia bacterium]
DTKPPGMYYIYVAVFKVAGKNNLLAVHVVAILVVAATALVVRRIGARVGDDWAGAWSGIGYAVFVHAYRPADTLPANTEIFASLFLALSVLAFLQGERKAGWGWMFLSGALVGVATLIRQPSAVTLGAMLAYLGYLWLIPRYQSLGRILAAGSGVVTGFIAVIAGLAWYYQWQGNLHDAYLWAWAFAIRYVEFETTFPYVLKRLVTVHLAVMLAWGLLWYFGIWQVIETLRSFRRRSAVPTEQVLLILWLILSYLGIFIGWRFPGHYHLAVLPPLSILAGHAFSRFVAEQRRCPQPRWRWIRAGIIGAAALPAIGFLTVAFATRVKELDFLPIVQHIVKETTPNDRIFVWGSSPQLYSFSGRRMATRFVSCTHLVGAYAARPREVKDRAESVIPGSWEMFRRDWEAHPPALIVDLSTVVPDWATHPMTRYPVLRAYLPGYRVEAVINGRTIYRRL